MAHVSSVSSSVSRWNDETRLLASNKAFDETDLYYDDNHFAALDACQHRKTLAPDWHVTVSN